MKTNHSKRYRAARGALDQSKRYTVEEAVAAFKGLPGVKFDATVECHAHVSRSGKKTDQAVRGTVSFPHAFGKSKRIAAFVPSDQEAAARLSGATLVGGAELVEEIRQKGVLDFDVAVAHPSVMRDLSKIVKLLGPKGLMPNPKNETVTTDVAKTIKELAGGKAAFRADSGGNVHVPCAKLSQEPATIVENVNAFITALKTSVGSATVSLTLSTTMGPGVKISL